MKDWLDFYASIVAENIKRKRGKMSQQKLADKAGISRTVVQRAESKKGIELDGLLRIAHGLGIEPGDLFLSDQDRHDVTYKLKKLMDLLSGEPGDSTKAK